MIKFEMMQVFFLATCSLPLSSLLKRPTVFCSCVKVHFYSMICIIFALFLSDDSPNHPNLVSFPLHFTVEGHLLVEPHPSILQDISE